MLSSQVYNDSNCGPQYSTYQQIAFCALPQPPTWPPVTQASILVLPAACGFHQISAFYAAALLYCCCCCTRRYR